MIMLKVYHVIRHEENPHENILEMYVCAHDGNN